jgi:ABC-type multidrug transport system fused ATPase/permease subunit
LFDAQAEYEIYGYLKSLLAGKTSLLISYRFSTVRRADKIAVIEKGAIQKYGTHDELMAFHGLYQRLYRLRADQYR